jgi:sarcosine oxidase subunit gamma
VTAETPERSPLQHRDALGRIAASELAFAAQVSLRLDPRSVDGAGPWSLPANTWLEDDGREALWLGPDEWLIVGARGTAAAVVDDFARRLVAVPHSIVDVSANRAVIELTGDRRSAMLAQGCSIDLHPRSWRAGMCAQTLLAHVPVILQERTDATRVFVRPSYAEWLVAWMLATSS